MLKLILDALISAGKVAMEKGPACFVITLILCATMGVAGYAYADKYFATAESVEALAETIDKGFAGISARMNLKDSSDTVQDLIVQVRQQEREISVLEMVIEELGPTGGDSTELLRAQAFSLKQELAELQARLANAQQELIEDRRIYQQVSQ